MRLFVFYHSWLKVHYPILCLRPNGPALSCGADNYESCNQRTKPRLKPRLKNDRVFSAMNFVPRSQPSACVAGYVACLVLFPLDFLCDWIFAFSVGGIGRHAQFFAWSRCHSMRFSSVGLGGIGCLLCHSEFIGLIPFACHLTDRH